MKRFENIIGQNRAKRQLDFWIDSFDKTNFIPHLLLTGEKGNGKSRIAKEIARNLKLDGMPRKAIPVNSAIVKSVKVLIEDVFLPNDGREVTYFFDELHALPPRVVPALLTILEPNAHKRTSFTYDGLTLEFDWRKVSFLAATTETHKVFHALLDRFEKISLEAYNSSELAQIMKQSIEIDSGGAVQVDDPLLEVIAAAIRQNGRSADAMAKKVVAYSRSHGRKKFLMKDWQNLTKTLDLTPHGLTRHEIRALEILDTSGDMTLTGLASRLGMPSQVVQRDIELYLTRLGLVGIDGKRHITAAGREYLANLAKR